MLLHDSFSFVVRGARRRCIDWSDQMRPLSAAAFVTLTLANRATPLAPTAAAATAQAKAAGKAPQGYLDGLDALKAEWLSRPVPAGAR